MNTLFEQAELKVKYNEKLNVADTLHTTTRRGYAGDKPMSDKTSSFFNNPLWATNYNGLSEDQKYNRYYAVCQMAQHYQRQNPDLDTQTARFMAENGYNYGDRMDIHGQFTPATLEQVEAYYKGVK